LWSKNEFLSLTRKKPLFGWGSPVEFNRFF
jgi:hypothetical protein